ncbi:hypothetical protein QVD17_23420 [Tagetes erecta]|uniref:Receptor-like serine/threonine-protein kinase n=1 Tax=Tagetes erecta TaxID=13708 RepID=A0AAD8KE34_TARER|nr:hypothetical protein QVD17_23420 [Tagetes erecta]
MEIRYNILFISVLFSILATCTIQDDTMTVDQVLQNGYTLVSANRMYELGFFSPGRSSNRYLGIWFKNISPQTVVWVANRAIPITDSSGVFRLVTNGSLLVSAGSNNTTVWSSNTSLVFPTTINPVAQLLNTGNLVVREKGEEGFIWQSFDYPGDTFLPGMKLGKDLVSGIDRRFTAWKSDDDPSPSEFVTFMETNGFPQLFETQGSVPHSRTGPWNGVTFNGFPNRQANSIFSYEFVFNDKEVYFSYTVNTSIIARVTLSPDGIFNSFNWVDQVRHWSTYWSAIPDMCSGFGRCGPNGVCNAQNSSLCSCMAGFEPRKLDEWSASQWSSGCQRRKPLDCPNGDGFRAFKNVKLPDTRHSWYNRSMTLDECAAACKSNCTCTAYANIEITRGGSGCLRWFGDLTDVRTVVESQDLYVRMAKSDATITEYKSEPNSNKKRRTIIVVGTISSCILVMVMLGIAIAYLWRKKTRYLVKSPDGGFRRTNIDKVYYSMKSQHDGDGDGDYDNDNDDDTDTELSYYSLAQVLKATKDFSNENKLGEGGFGSVYMGILDDGREIAVKRLSKSSGQGINEFKNELKFIAKLQHRNLVKLLGYCNEGDESMLIYEYMPNKSLDFFIFDKRRSLTLDWSTRFHIIHEIARGILYLHQDSRLKIVHRDLKASNILLDDDMNPKISDFGLARMFRDHENEANTTRVVGTLGYISPEYAIEGIFSEKSDVFSFGVLVLEIISGKKNRGFSDKKDSDSLLAHAWRLFKEDMALELLSPHMRESSVDSKVLRSIHIGLLCVQHYAKDRPSMAYVVLMFDQDDALPSPKQPAFFTKGTMPKVNQISVNEVTMTELEAR